LWPLRRLFAGTMPASAGPALQQRRPLASPLFPDFIAIKASFLFLI